MNPDINWPLSSIIYHIYPRSFFDTNADGIGDLKGIIEKIDYIAELGINAVWLSPVYPSPQKDFGYDVADYTNIDPVYGNLESIDELIAKLHERGIKLLMDYVPNHTSNEHQWFLESKSSKKNPKRDWYIWKDARDDGSPPNNWISVFGGSAWEYDEKTKQYYLHSFDKAQPDLNWRNPEVVEAMLDVFRFWLDRGVDGFRIDAVYWLFKHADFPDEPNNPSYMMGTHEPYDMYLHPYTFALPETLHMMKTFTDVIKEYDNKFVVMEIYAGLEELLKMYRTIDWKYFTPFNFSLITLPWKAEIHKQFIDEFDKALGDIYIPSYVLGNHDKPRVTTRLGDKQARIAAMSLLTLRGLPFIYYGDELGMTDGVLERKDIKDPFAMNFPDLPFGRDPQRTPMQWNTTKNAGFTHGDPWLPVNPNHMTRNVAVENTEYTSLLSLYKLLIKLKKHKAALREGTYTPLPLPQDNVLAFIRETDKEKILIMLNFDEKEKNIKMDYEGHLIASASMTHQEWEKIDLNNFVLTGDEGLIIELNSTAQ